MATHAEAVTKVLARLADYCQDEGNAECIFGVLDVILDDLASEDFFGTEQQCDPRGDFRDGDWSMDNVQGLDD